MPSPPPLIEMSFPSTSIPSLYDALPSSFTPCRIDILSPNRNPPTSKPTAPSTLWPFPTTLSPNGFALHLLAFLAAASFLIIITLYLTFYLRRHYSRRRLGFDIERNSGSGAYARVFRDGQNYKSRNSPRRVKGWKGVKEGRERVWEDWVGRDMERGRQRDRDRERRRDRERHLERGKQIWNSRAVGYIGMGAVGGPVGNL
jgi:hypothetical protein